LRLWELGAVIMSLKPESIYEVSDPPKKIEEYLANVKRLEGNGPEFSIKLGHGRPLGLGSVRTSIVKTKKWTDKPELVEDKELHVEAVKGLWKRLRGANEDVLIQWLKVHQYKGRERAAYPTGGRDKTIFGFHSGVRVAHARARRSDGARLNPNTLQSLE
jgi:hypothetical protein